eukprot:TRINITY_DN1395_c0_g1_i1.p1 TRINITY_DN1395_c0_g1~~TRINITY_DN1395_c0_g1_i1.p1  ORF type:complete len:397 (+),score=67.12 TRINITY_DN1395_c0_g1_i1:143-1192(+)
MLAEGSTLKQKMGSFMASNMVGAVFPDGGYVPQKDGAWGEDAHWEPFVEASIQHMRSDPNCSEQAQAFLFASAMHGIEDESFDSVYERKVSNVDSLDSDVDMLMGGWGYSEPYPGMYLPLDDLCEIYEAIGVEPPTDFVFRSCTETCLLVSLTLQRTPPAIVALVEENQVWVNETLLDPCEPGSLTQEVYVASAYLEALQKRLEGTFTVEDDLIISHYPLPGTYLKSVNNTQLENTISVFFGLGVQAYSITNSTVSLFYCDHDSSCKKPVACASESGHYGSVVRVAIIHPLDSLLYNSEYEVHVTGLTLVDGSVMDPAAVLSFRFKTPPNDQPQPCPLPPAPSPTLPVA